MNIREKNIGMKKCICPKVEESSKYSDSTPGSKQDAMNIS